ncbi:MAG: pantoate--beta-alanine ligase [Sedimentisphaerales bacterium]|nr:pantoate--beta-alanine ligase [Sedimentisphaerales bacterium]
MEVCRTIESVRDMVGKARGEGKRIGLAPTMGALHIGHVSLLRRAAEECDFVVVSIFVNPTQFGPGEDFDNYPRPFDRDLDICRKSGVDIVFAPTAGIMYPDENLTWVEVEKLTEPLCGMSRTGHFRGVTTVCAKLFNIVLPDAAYFGLKDAQQAAVIKKMVADLNMALEIVVCPTVREANGLAVSSRNKYLSETQREEASKIYASLLKCEELIAGGETNSSKIVRQMREILDEIAGGEVEYVEIVDAGTLAKVETVKGSVLAAVALKLGRARLIDNIVCRIIQPEAQ